MKKCKILIITVLVALLISACSGQEASEGAEHMSDDLNSSAWQEQYDLGVRYLSEGNYEEAVLAFTAAIEIDPKQAPAYVGRGDAYVLSGETEGNLSAAKADYEKAIELDETSAEAYMGLADVYIRQGKYEEAWAVLTRGVEKTGNKVLQTMLDSIAVEEVDRYGRNAYGATAFTLRERYVPFQELAAEEQRFIEQAANAVMEDDRNTLLALSEPMAEFFANRPVYLYTVWNRYKIGVGADWPGVQVDDGAYLIYNWDIEIRPKDGMGYYADIRDRKILDSDQVTDSWYDEYSWNFYIATCPCTDWQWNGAFNAQSYVDCLQYWNDGMIRRILRTDNITGEMKENMREGVFTTTYEITYEYLDGMHETAHWEQQFTELFSEGAFVEASEGQTTIKSPGALGSIDQSSYMWAGKWDDRFCW